MSLDRRRARLQRMSLAGPQALVGLAAEVVGTAGVLEIGDWVSDEAGALALTTANGRKEIPFEASDRYRLEIEGFADAVQGRCPPRVRLVESARNARILEQVFAEMA